MVPNAGWKQCVLFIPVFVFKFFLFQGQLPVSYMPAKIEGCWPGRESLAAATVAPLSLSLSCAHYLCIRRCFSGVAGVGTLR